LRSLPDDEVGFFFGRSFGPNRRKPSASSGAGGNFRRAAPVLVEPAILWLGFDISVRGNDDDDDDDGDWFGRQDGENHWYDQGGGLDDYDDYSEDSRDGRDEDC
jgi:hypothetical protein